MRQPFGSYGRLERAALLLGLLVIPLYLVVITTDRPQTISDLIGSMTVALLVYLFILGIGVMFSMKGRGNIPAKRWVIWMLAYAFLLGFVLLLYEVAFPESDFIEIIVEEDGVIEWMANGVGLSIAMFILGLLMVPFSFSCTWIMVKILRRYLPQYLFFIKFHRSAGGWDVTGRIAYWLVDLPKVLEPGSLDLDLERSRMKRTRRRWLELLFWQMALGLLVAVYVSLNPVLLENMSYTAVFGLVTYVAFLVPFLVLPWSTLESIGARLKGVRKDFYLHEGAKARMVQTLVAMGTIVLIVRLGITEIGAGEIASAFSIYALGLISLSGLVSFIYFNYFEKDLVKDIISRVDEAVEKVTGLN